MNPEQYVGFAILGGFLIYLFGIGIQPPKPPKKKFDLDDFRTGS